MTRRASSASAAGCAAGPNDSKDDRSHSGIVVPQMSLSNWRTKQNEA